MAHARARAPRIAEEVANLLALVIIDTLIVLLLTVLVVGLLRSHADILRALHRLGAGVEDPVGESDPAGAQRMADGSMPTPLVMGPPLPGERSSSSAPDVVGVTPEGDGKAVGVTGVAHRTLLVFLSSGCATCAGIWSSLADPTGAGLPDAVRIVAVTKGPELEISSEVARKAPPGLVVVMSTGAWGDYEVPGSPFFVLVDGPAGRRAGEGVATELSQVAELVRRAGADGERPSRPTTQGRPHASGLDGAAREQQNDTDLAASGILPGDPSLYPTTLEDLFEPEADPEPGGVGKPEQMIRRD